MSDYLLSSYTDLKDAADRLNGTDCRLIIDCDQTMDENVNFDSHVMLVPTPGNTITLGTYSLTVNKLAPTGLFQWLNQSSSGKASFAVEATCEVNAAWWGLSYDGTGNMGPAIQAAIDAAPEKGTVVLPAGEFRTEQSLRIEKDDFTFRGAGLGATYIEFWPTSTAGAFLTIGGSGSGSLKENWTLSDMTLTGRTEYTSHGIVVQYAQHWKISRVGVVAFYDHGIHLAGENYAWEISNCYISQNGTSSSHSNINGATPNVINGGTIRNCRIREAGDAHNNPTKIYSTGIRVCGMGINIVDNVFEKHAIAIHIAGGGSTRHRGGRVSGNYIEWVTSTGIHIGQSDAVASGVVVVGNYIEITQSDVDSGIYLDYATGIVVHGNTFHHQSSGGADSCIYAFSNVTNCEFGPDDVWADSGTAPPYFDDGGDTNDGIRVIEDGVVTRRENGVAIGTLAKDTTAIETSGTGVSDLHSTLVPGGVLGTSRGLRIRAFGVKEGTGGNKEIKLHWGGTSYILHQAANNTNDWFLEAEIINADAANIQRINWRCWDGDNVRQGYAHGQQNTASAVTVQLSGVVTDGSDNITQRFWHVETF